MKVRFAPEARSDLNEILDYIDKQSPSGALNVKAAIKRTVSLIGEFPNAGRLIGMQDVRVLRAGSYPYLVYWIVENSEARIVHIRHARRKPWTEELEEGG